MSYLLETLGRGWIGHLSDAFEQRMRDAFFIAEHMAVQDEGDVRIEKASPKKAEEAEFIMLQDGKIGFEGSAKELRAIADTDPYIQAFLA
jgi:hypothetical protein